jgi:uncharacterized membrane protein
MRIQDAFNRAVDRLRQKRRRRHCWLVPDRFDSGLTIGWTYASYCALMADWRATLPATLVVAVNQPCALAKEFVVAVGYLMPPSM